MNISPHPPQALPNPSCTVFKNQSLKAHINYVYSFYILSEF